MRAISTCTQMLTFDTRSNALSPEVHCSYTIIGLQFAIIMTYVITMSCRHSCVTEITCPTPELPTMATYNVKSLTYKSRVLYTCHKGYSITSGDEELTCQANGVWSGTTPTCESESGDYCCPVYMRFTYFLLIITITIYLINLSATVDSLHHD